MNRGSFFDKSMVVVLLCVMISTLLSPSMAYGAAYEYAVPEGTPTVDGIISIGEWNRQGRHVFHRMYNVASKIETFMMWDASNLYLAAFVADTHLWDEANPNPWEDYNDDSIDWMLDINNDQALQMQPGDFLLQVEPGGGVLLNQGTSVGGTAALSSNSYVVKTSYVGTLNNNSDIDTGFSFEAKIPWNILNFTPREGVAFGSTVIRNSDEDGGNFVVTSNATTTFYDPNEWVSSRGGEKGDNRVPATWAKLVLSSGSDVTPPAAPSGLVVNGINPFRAWLDFLASGDNGNEDAAYGYRVYLSSTPQAAPENFTLYKVLTRAEWSGARQGIRIAGLTPATEYKVYVCAVDEAGNQSSPSNIITFTTLAAPDSSLDKGFVIPGPNGRYFIRENGEPLLASGHGIPMNLFRTVFLDTQSGYSVGSFFTQLKNSGVTVIRMFCEDMLDSIPLETSPGQFNSEAIAVIEEALHYARENGIYIILVPWDNYYYQGAGPYPGIINDIRYEWYSNQNVRVYQKARLQKLVDIVGAHQNLFMWELNNEYDNEHWNGEDETDRQEWLREMAEFLRGIDPDHIIAASFNTPNPHGFQAKAGIDYNDWRFNSSVMHLYLASMSNPNTYYYLTGRNPFEYATGLDKGFLPAVRTGQAMKFAYGQQVDSRPVFSSETGPIELETGISSYSPDFTQADDERMFNAINWSHLAGGGAGVGLRFTALTSTSLLTTKMYDYYGLYRAFTASGIDWANYNPENISEDIVVTGVDLRYLAKSGISDGTSAIIYLTVDSGVGGGMHSGVSITLPDMIPVATYDIEYWNASDSSARSPITTDVVTSDANGILFLNLPGWSPDIAIKICCGQSHPPIPSIRINGLSGSEPVGVVPGSTIKIDVSLVPGSYEGQIADWWLLAYNPNFGWFSYRYSLPEKWTAGILPIFDGGFSIFSFSEFPVLEDLSVLPAGNYTFYFGVEGPADNSLDAIVWSGLDAVQMERR